jgi:HAE1 family hydrophobic/amphiphilic exporter-1
MASQFESLLHPFVIIFTLPLGLIGAVGALAIAGMSVSVVAMIGMVMLAGIVVNNAIVLVDYVGKLKARGLSTPEALELAGRVRLRPILMTTLTTVLGLVPMALGLGDGAEIRMPMAITVISGLSCSTALTLLVIPTLYGGIDRLRGARVGAGVGAALDAELAAVRADQLSPENAAEAD